VIREASGSPNCGEHGWSAAARTGIFMDLLWLLLAFTALMEALSRSLTGTPLRSSRFDVSRDAFLPGMMTDRPFSHSHKKLRFWLFIIAGHDDLRRLSRFPTGFLRNATQDWPRPSQYSQRSVMTFILLTSTLTMRLGVQRPRLAPKAGSFRWTMITALGRCCRSLFLHIENGLD